MVLMSFLAHGFALLVALLGPGAFASENCPLGEIHCAAGSTVSGGCFNPALAAYQGGLICSVPLAVCRRGSIGPGACFRTDRFTCDLARLRVL